MEVWPCKWQLASEQTILQWYRALYSVMLSGEVARSTKTPMFLSLLFKAMQADVSLKRQAAFAKRLLQVAVEQPAPFACGSLILLSELMKVQLPGGTTPDVRAI